MEVNAVDPHLFFSGFAECFILPDDYASIKHWHKEIEFAHVISGSLVVLMEDTRYHMKPGQSLLINRWVLHQYDRNQDTDRVAVLKFSGETVLNNIFRDSIKKDLESLIKYSFLADRDSGISKTIQEMLGANFGEYNECFISAKIMEIFTYLLHNPVLIVNKVKTKVVNNVYLLDAAFKYLWKNCNKKITLRHLADYLGISESYCSKYIKEKVGLTFIELLTALRVKNAEQLLLSGERNITEIAYDAGFSSLQTFNRVFRKAKQMSPTEYRKKEV